MTGKLCYFISLKDSKVLPTLANNQLSSSPFKMGQKENENRDFNTSTQRQRILLLVKCANNMSRATTRTRFGHLWSFETGKPFILHFYPTRCHQPFLNPNQTTPSYSPNNSLKYQLPFQCRSPKLLSHRLSPLINRHHIDGNILTIKLIDSEV